MSYLFVSNIEQVLMRMLMGLSLGMRAKGSLILSAATFARNILGLLSILMIARYLPPEEFGRLMFAFGLATVLAPLAAMGIERLAVRRMISEPENIGPIAATTLGLRFGGALFGLILATGITGSGLIYEEAQPLLTLLACFALFHSAIDGLVGTLIANEKFKFAAIPSILAALVSFAFVVLVVSNDGMPLEFFAATRVVDALVFIVAIPIAVRLSGIHLANLWPSKAIAMDLLRTGFPIILAAIVYSVFLRMDQLMLAALSTETELGLYSLSLRLAEAFNFVPIVICTAFYPHLARLRDQSNQAYETELHFLFEVMVVVSVGVVLFVWAVSAFLVTPLFGEAYSRSSGIAAVLVLSIPFVAMGLARGNAFTITGDVWLPLAIWSGPVVVNFLGNLLLIPAFAGYGAAVSTVLSLFIAHLATSFMFPSLRTHGAAMIRSLNIRRSAVHVLRRLQII